MNFVIHLSQRLTIIEYLPGMPKVLGLIYNHTHTHTHTHRDRETHRERDRERDRQTDRDRQREREKGTHTHTHTHTHTASTVIILSKPQNPWMYSPGPCEISPWFQPVLYTFIFIVYLSH